MAQKKKAAPRKNAKRVAKRTTNKKTKTAAKTTSKTRLTAAKIAADLIDGIAVKEIEMPTPSAEDMIGDFSSGDYLRMRSNRDQLIDARWAVTTSVRELIEASIKIAVNGNATENEAHVLAAQQDLAVARFEHAMGEFEKLLRG